MSARVGNSRLPVSVTTAAAAATPTHWRLAYLRRFLLGQERLPATDHAAHGLTGLRVLLQRRVTERLPYLEAPRGGRQGLVGVGGHGTNLTARNEKGETGNGS